MKKIIYKILFLLLGAIIVGSAGFYKLTMYGGNSCDVDGKTCDCFCCHMFGLRGYEACGKFGLIAGLLIGACFGFLFYQKLLKK